MLSKISQTDIYQLEKSELLETIRQCGVEPETNSKSRELRKIGAFLKRLGRIVESDLELKNDIAALNADPTLKLASNKTSVCPELFLYTLLLQGEFKLFFDKIDKTSESPESLHDQNVFSLKSPRMRSPPPPPPTPKEHVINTNVAINALAEELKRISGLVQELRVEHQSKLTPVVTQTERLGNRRTDQNFVGLDEGIKELSSQAQRIETVVSNPSNQNLCYLGNTKTSNITKPSFELVSVLPTFSGDGDEIVADFIAQVNDVGNLSDWNDQNKLTVAKLKLSGTALSFSKSDEGCQFAKTLNEFQEALETRFRDKLPEHYYLEQLACLRQERGETIETFADRVKRIGSKTVRRTQNQLVDQALQKEGDRRTMEAFTRGLSGELGHEVRIKFPQSFREAVTLAVTIRNVERRPSEDSRVRNNKGVFFTPSHEPVKCQICYKFGHNSQECGVQVFQRRPNHTNFHNNQNTQNPMQVPVRNSQPYHNFPAFNRNSLFQPRFPLKFCAFCKREGHLEEECRSKVRHTNFNLSQCQVCGKRGHNAQVCRFAQSNRNFNHGNMATARHPTTNYAGGPKPATGPPNN